MKTYKLIKEYPGSPELGIIAEERYIMKDQPEFWEEVIEKDYEIVSQIPSIRVCDPKNNYNVVRNTTPVILSVKRLSDGEVFTVGDLIKTPYAHCTRITGFNTDYSNEYFIEIPTGFTRLLSLEKVKQPIFLTHDGKDIFDGDKVWYVNKENFYYDYIITHSEVKFNSDLNAYFLTRQDAEDYIKKSKVIFTTEDGVDIKHGYTYYFVDTDFSIHTMKAHPGAGQYSERKYFSTVEEAHEYVMQNVKALSIKDFWEITCMSTSNFNKSAYMRDLVKKTLGIK